LYKPTRNGLKWQGTVQMGSGGKRPQGQDHKVAEHQNNMYIYCSKLLFPSDGTTSTEAQC